MLLLCIQKALVCLIRPRTAATSAARHAVGSHHGIKSCAIVNHLNYSHTMYFRSHTPFLCRYEFSDIGEYSSTHSRSLW